MMIRPLTTMLWNQLGSALLEIAHRYLQYALCEKAHINRIYLTTIRNRKNLNRFSLKIWILYNMEMKDEKPKTKNFCSCHFQLQGTVARDLFDLVFFMIQHHMRPRFPGKNVFNFYSVSNSQDSILFWK